LLAKRLSLFPFRVTAYVTNINTCKILSKTAAAPFNICSSLWFVIRHCHNLDHTPSNDKIVTNREWSWRKQPCRD